MTAKHERNHNHVWRHFILTLYGLSSTVVLVPLRFGDDAFGIVQRHITVITGADEKRAYPLTAVTSSSVLTIGDMVTTNAAYIPHGSRFSPL